MREGGGQAFVLQRVCLVSIRFLISFFLFSIFSFFFFDPTTVNLGEAVHFLLFLRPEDEWS